MELALLGVGRVSTGSEALPNKIFKSPVNEYPGEIVHDCEKGGNYSAPSSLQEGGEGHE